jgi:sugar lactone lactonase YvrE
MAEEALFVSRRLTEKGEYPKGIEGPAVDAAGNLYVVNLHEKGTIGSLRPGASKSELFAKLPKGSVGNGRIFVTRIVNGTVAVVSPEGEIEREVPLLGKEPTNLTFGGPDGKTVYVTQSQGGSIEAFRVDRAGREH